MVSILPQLAATMPAMLARRSVILMLLAMLLWCVAGCVYSTHAKHWLGSATTSMTVTGAAAAPVRMPLQFSASVVAEDPQVDASFWMTDIPLDALERGDVVDGQVLHVELLFHPRPGYTPLDPTATNLVIRWVVISRGEIGIYEGGGFGYPVGSLDDPAMSLAIHDASLKLGPHTAGFVDLLTPANLSGSVHSARYDTVAVSIRDGIDALLSGAFGEQMWVQAH